MPRGTASIPFDALARARARRRVRDVTSGRAALAFVRTQQGRSIEVTALETGLCIALHRIPMMLSMTALAQLEIRRVVFMVHAKAFGTNEARRRSSP